MPANRKEEIVRRKFLEKMGLGALGVGTVAGSVLAAEKPKIQGFGEEKAEPASSKKWEPVSDRKIRVGIVGHGLFQFGAAFGFQDHPNVEIVAVSDLLPDRRRGLMKACRCDKSYESLEEMVKDDKIEALYVATDAPSHAAHCIEAVKHGKHVMSAVPATFGTIEQGEQLLEAVEKSGMKYMMAETSSYSADCYAIRQVYQAGGFGRLIYSEGEYYHYCPTPIGSYKGWRVGLPPQWYPTHSTAYYVGVTGERFTSVSCGGFRGDIPHCQPDANPYKNPFSDETALFQTSEGGTSRMTVSWGVQGYHGIGGRVFGRLGSMDGTKYKGVAKNLADIERPALPPGVSGGGHGGSHGRLTNEFITSILADRLPLVDIYEALAMTIPGIVAHQSALKDGEQLKIPQFDRPKKA